MRNLKFRLVGKRGRGGGRGERRGKGARGSSLYSGWGLGVGKRMGRGGKREICSKFFFLLLEVKR